jgi:aryl-alcohol dehydrogenase-like predicted oxidoreductase
MAATGRALAALVAEGKIRAFGLSNDTAWGTMRWLRLAEAGAAPRVATVQNEYSLLCRLYDTDMAEVSVREEDHASRLFAAGGGAPDGQVPGRRGARGLAHVADAGAQRAVTPRAHAAVAAYHEVAARHGLDPVQMAIAFTRRGPSRRSRSWARPRPTSWPGRSGRRR